MEYVAYKSEYKQQVVDTLNLCLPTRQINSTSFNWKHMDPYFGNEQVAMVALDNNSVASFVCLTPLNIKAPNGNIEHFYSCAIQATHPSYRRRGLVTQLTKSLESKLGPTAEYIGFSNKEGVKIDKYSKSINYHILGELVTKYRVNIPRLSSDKICFREMSISEFSKDNVLRYSNRFYSLQKDSKYLDWRYIRNPKHQYKYY